MITTVSDNCIELVATEYREVLRFALLCDGLVNNPKKLRMVRHAFVTFIIGDLDDVLVANDTEGHLPGHESSVRDQRGLFPEAEG